MTDKVYCSKCKWLWEIEIIGKAFCDHPLNRKDSWYMKGTEHIFGPQEKNKDNNCSDFSPLLEKKKSWLEKVRIMKQNYRLNVSALTDDKK